MKRWIVTPIHRGSPTDSRFAIGETMKYLVSRVVIVVIVLGCILDAGTAQADWFVAGAQYSCRPHSHLFEMIPYSTFSGIRDQSEETPMKTGFSHVRYPASPIECVLGGKTLQTTVAIIEPYEGNGMGGGRVDILSMKIGALELLSTTEYLDWDAERPEERVIHIRVTVIKRFASVERCYGWISLKEGEIGKENVAHCDTSQTRIRP